MPGWQFRTSSFLDDLEWVRTENGISKRQFAKMLGISPSTYVELHTRDRTPSLRTVVNGIPLTGQDYWEYVLPVDDE